MTAAAPRARPGRLAPLGDQQIVGMVTSTALTIPTAANGRANCALIRAESQSVRWRDTPAATAPTATVGNLLPAGTDMWYEGDLNLLLFIEVAATATLDVSYYETSAAQG